MQGLLVFCGSAWLGNVRLFASRNNPVPTRSRLSSRIGEMAVIAVGIFILADTLVGVIRNLRLWHLWLVLLAGAIEASMGLCLIVFGLRMRRIEPVFERAHLKVLPERRGVLLLG